MSKISCFLLIFLTVLNIGNTLSLEEIFCEETEQALEEPFPLTQVCCITPFNLAA
ncbi:MAG: hypothetical protein KR126chlam1_01512 [Chlamydiae bacterium]|nr:hypothetical protein [Chlamydiota bacterium]